MLFSGSDSSSESLDAFIQVLGILARLSIAERASIDECYLDISEEAKKRMAACAGYPALPVNMEQVHVCGEVRLKELLYALTTVVMSNAVHVVVSHLRPDIQWVTL